MEYYGIRLFNVKGMREDEMSLDNILNSVKVIADRIPWPIVVPIIFIYVSIVIKTIVDVRRRLVETFIWNPEEEDYKGLKIYEEGDIDNGNNILLVNSKNNLFNICIYNGIEPCADLKHIKVNQYNCNQLKDVLTPKEGLMLSFYFAGYGQKLHLLTFENEAFMSAQLPIYLKGRYGNKTETVKYKMTIKSFLYFLLCGTVKYKGE